MIVTIKTDGCRLTAEQPIIADGSAGTVRVRFCPDDSWAGLTLTAVFRTPRGDYLMPLTNGECTLPAEVTKTCGNVLVGVFGTDGTRTLTSVFCRMHISPGVPTEGEAAANYTPGLYEQFAAKFARFENMTATVETGDVPTVEVEHTSDAVALHFTLPKVEQGDTSADADTVPAYVAAEVDRVAAEVLARQNENTFSFLAVSDMHNMETGSAAEECQKALLHAGQAMSLLREKVQIDFAVNFGDFTWGETDFTTVSMGQSEILNSIKMCHKAFCDIPHFYLKGNHDDLAWNLDGYFSASETFAMLGKRNAGAVFPTEEKERGYCYRDFDAHKLRVIALNTVDSKGIVYPVNLLSGDEVEVERTSIGRISAAQLQWLAKEALDMTGKEGWQVILLGHHYLKLGYSKLVDSAGCAWDQGCNQVVTLLDAYTNGASGSITTTYTGETVTYDFSGKNAAPIVATFNGHLHNFKTGVQGSAQIPWITIPNAFPGRDNERGRQGEYVYGEEITYPKTADSAEDTAFCVITVDTAAKKIYATHYGAGYDRMISYGDGETEVYTVTNTLTNVSTSNSVESVSEGEAYSATLTADAGYTIDSVSVTMGNTDVTESVYSNGTITIPAVTGDIVIAASGAVSADASYTNLLPTSVDTDGSIYGGVGYRTDTYLSSSSGLAGTAEDSATTGFMPLPEIDTDAYALGAAVVYFANIEALESADIRVALYPEDKTSAFDMHLAANFITESAFTDNPSRIVKYTDEDGYITALDLSGYMCYCANKSDSPFVPKWFRLSLPSISDASIITVNEPIETESAASYTNLISTATEPVAANADISTEVYNDGLGYKNDTRISGMEDVAESGYVATGIIPYAPTAGEWKPLYVKGATLDTTLSSVRCTLIQWTETGLAYGKHYLSGGSTNTATMWSTYFTIEELGDQYYKLTPVSGNIGTNVKYLRMSLVGTGENLILTENEPIE